MRAAAQSAGLDLEGNNNNNNNFDVLVVTANRPYLNWMVDEVKNDHPESFKNFYTQFWQFEQLF